MNKTDVCQCGRIVSTLRLAQGYHSCEVCSERVPQDLFAPPPMIKDPRLNLDHVQELIRAAERRQGFRLNSEDFLFLTKVITSFMDKCIDKFIAGAHEHNSDGEHNFIDAVDHESEMENEIIDMWNYYVGMKNKRK